jgi:hypothetical protein
VVVLDEAFTVPGASPRIPVLRKRVRRKVIGRTKTEMKAKFRDLRRDLESGAGPA